MQISIKFIIISFIALIALSAMLHVWNNEMDMHAFLNKYFPVLKPDKISVAVAPLTTSRIDSTLIINATITNLGSKKVLLEKVVVVFNASINGDIVSGPSAEWRGEVVSLEPGSPERVSRGYGGKTDTVYEMAAIFSGLPFDVYLMLTISTSKGRYPEPIQIKIGSLQVRAGEENTGYHYTGVPGPIVIDINK